MQNSINPEVLLLDVFSASTENSAEASEKLANHPEKKKIASILLQRFTSFESFKKTSYLNVGLWNLFSYTLPSLISDRDSREYAFEFIENLYTLWCSRMNHKEFKHLEKSTLRIDLKQSDVSQLLTGNADETINAYEQLVKKNAINSKNIVDNYNKDLNQAPICYMAFDLLLKRIQADDVDVAEGFLASLHKILSIPSKACQEAALHGLGHLQMPSGSDLENRRRAYIENFISVNDDPDLIRYAQASLNKSLQ